MKLNAGYTCIMHTTGVESLTMTVFHEIKLETSTKACGNLHNEN